MGNVRQGLVLPLNTANENLSFLKLWFRRPASLGAVLPSGRSLALAMAGEIDPTAPGVVLELGAGTGSITAALLESGKNPENIVVIEREAVLCRFLAARFPQIHVIYGDARWMRILLRNAGIKSVGAIVSGLPFLSIPKKVRIAIIAQAFSVLPNDGILVQFTYGPAPPVSHSLTKDLDILGDRSSWVLDNLPPATVWRYRRASFHGARHGAVSQWSASTIDHSRPIC